MIYIEIKINGLNINYIKEGKGKPVLILPGWGTTVDTYRVLINDLAKYRTVYCLDMPGQGKSDEMKESYDVDNYVDLVDKFIQKLNIKELDLIGHSNGGRIIIKLLGNKELKHKYKVEKVVLIGSAGVVPKKTFKQKYKIFQYKLCKKLINNKLIKKINPEFENKVKTKFGSEDYKNASPVMRQTLVKLVNTDLREYMPNIKQSVLLIWGEKDDATPIKGAEIMEKLIPDAGLVRIKDCTHYVFLEQPAYVNRIIKTFIGDK